MMNAKESVAAYCKAQSDINKIDKMNEEQKKTLNERIKTCRSLLQDALINKKINCIEVYEDNETDPVYFRLKPITTNVNWSIDTIVQIVQFINREQLMVHAEKNNNDLPKMISATIQNYAKDEKKKQVTDKMSLTITPNRERGYTRETNTNIPNETIQLAKELLAARRELTSIKQKASNEKKGSITAQKEVEQVVKEALKVSDPENKTSRVHMMQGDSEWVYYLRCKEQEKTQPLGIRKIVPIIENAVATVLDAYGLPREYNDTLKLDSQFWNELCTKITTQFHAAEGETKTVSKLSLDRGAPRVRKK